MYRRTLRAENGKSLRIRLSTPAPGEICPLTLEPVSGDELDFLPGVTFIEDMPRVRLATLPCRHTFGAMSLLYHFLRHNMLCPCCRAGHAARLDAQSVPPHCRAPLVARVIQFEIEDRNEQIRADTEAAQAAQTDGDDITAIAANLALILGGRGVDLSVFVGPNDETPAYLSFQFRLVPVTPLDQLPEMEPTSQFVFATPLQEHRRLTANLSNYPEAAVDRLSFVVHGRSPADRVVELARAGPAPAVSRDVGERELTAGPSNVRLHYMPPTGALSHISWVAPGYTLLPLLMD